MDRELVKLRKNKNNSAIYQIYLPKLHENILKYNRLNVFKEIGIGIGFNHCLQMTLEFPVSLFDGLLVLNGKCCYYSCLQFIFGAVLKNTGNLFAK